MGSLIPWDLLCCPMQPQPITDFIQDAEGHWVAILACGHRQHVRHNPPLVERPWVLTPSGRAERLGLLLVCLHCSNLPSGNGPLVSGDGNMLC